MWDHQLTACQLAVRRHDFAFFFEQGTGKTRTVIETLLFKFAASGGPVKTLIFTPPAVVAQFRSEWFKYSDLKPSQVVALTGSAVRRLKTFQESKKAKIFVTNYEALIMKDLFAAFLEWAPECVVWDESHKLKSPSTARSKLANDLSNPFDRKTKKKLPKPHTYLLSGTPVLNSPMDLFQQIKIMDGGEAFGDNFFAFRAKYFRDRNAMMPRNAYFPKWEAMTARRDGIDAIGMINKKLSEISMRVEKADCLDLPPEIDVKIPVGMTEEQAKHYQEMKADLITYLGSKACVATMAITKALRLMQLTSGFISVEGDDGQVEIELKDTPKMAALKGLLEEICENPKNKVIVWTAWRKTYQDIGAACTALELGFVEVHGGIAESKKMANIDAFRTDPNIRVFISHPGSGGVGINLVEAGYSIRYSRTFSLEQWLQSRARNHRGGSKEAGHKSIVHYELICEDTIDALVLEKLANKVDLSNSLLSNLRQELGGI